MKKFINLALILTTIAFVSCTKETISGPIVNSAPVAITVEYRVFSESGHVNVQYTSFDNGAVTTTSVLVDRTNFSYAFNWTSGQTLSVGAKNEMPSAKNVHVEIYVNGVLFKSAETSQPNTTAKAEGIYN